MQKYLVLMIMLIMPALSVHATQLKVTFINPGFEKANPTGPFWYEVAQIMQASANDFNIDLSIKYANRNHIMMKSLIADALKKSPDFLILVDEKSITTDYLLTLEKRSTAIYYLLNSPDDTSLARLKKHGHKVVGSIVPDNFQAGKQLISSLSSLNNPTVPLNILALEGDYSTSASLDRSAGLRSEVEQQKNTTVIDSVVANWSEQQGYAKTLGLLKRHPHINTIWCANDAIAKGAIKALFELNKRESVNVGAINWSQPDLNSDIDVEVGGHVTLGGLAIVKLYDIYHGVSSSIPEHLQQAIFTDKNHHAMLLLKLLKNNKLNSLNFTQFSNTTAKPEPFSIANLIN